MRFTIAREKLQEALTSVAPAVPAKTTLPVLANILVEASERGVRFSGTDLDLFFGWEHAPHLLECARRHDEIPVLTLGHFDG